MVFPASRCGQGGTRGGAGEVTAVDLSAGGVRFRSEAPFEPGDRAVLTMAGGSGARALVGVEVVHATRSGATTTCGARFMALTPDMVRSVLTMPHNGRGVRAHRASA